MKGKIVLVPFPFTDLTAAKLRPALVLYEGEKDVILAFISSKIPDNVSDLDVLILSSQNGFIKTGLKTDSIIRLDKLATILKDLVVGELGEIDDSIKQEINDKLIKIIRL